MQFYCLANSYRVQWSSVKEFFEKKFSHCVLKRFFSQVSIQKIQDIFREKSDRLYHWAEDRNVPADNNLAEWWMGTIMGKEASYSLKNLPTNNRCTRLGDFSG